VSKYVSKFVYPHGLSLKLFNQSVVRTSN